MAAILFRGDELNRYYRNRYLWWYGIISPNYCLYGISTSNVPRKPVHAGSRHCHCSPSTCHFCTSPLSSLNSLRPRPNRRHFADDTFKRIFLNGNVIISIKISLKFVPKGPINNIPALVQIMAWRRPGDKPLSEAMMVSLPTHICVTRPQWVKCIFHLLTGGGKATNEIFNTLGQNMRWQLSVDAYE